MLYLHCVRSPYLAVVGRESKQATAHCGVDVANEARGRWDFELAGYRLVSRSMATADVHTAEVQAVCRSKSLALLTLSGSSAPPLFSSDVSWVALLGGICLRRAFVNGKAALSAASFLCRPCRFRKHRTAQSLVACIKRRSCWQ